MALYRARAGAHGVGDRGGTGRGRDPGDEAVDAAFPDQEAGSQAAVRGKGRVRDKRMLPCGICPGSGLGTFLPKSGTQLLETRAKGILTIDHGDFASSHLFQKSGNW